MGTLTNSTQRHDTQAGEDPADDESQREAGAGDGRVSFRPVRRTGLAVTGVKGLFRQARSFPTFVRGYAAGATRTTDRRPEDNRAPCPERPGGNIRAGCPVCRRRLM